MKYGYLFNCYINEYGHEPSQNKCSALSYKELKTMAKNMYKDIKEKCNEFNVINPLYDYTRMPKETLPKAVYNALNYLYRL